MVVTEGIDGLDVDGLVGRDEEENMMLRVTGGDGSVGTLGAVGWKACRMC